MTVYRVGSNATPVAHFRLAHQPFDPTTVTLTIHKPRTPTAEVRTKADPTVFNDSTGDYATDLDLVERGTYRLVWEGVGTYVDSHARVRPFKQTVHQVLRVYS